MTAAARSIRRGRENCREYVCWDQHDTTVYDFARFFQLPLQTQDERREERGTSRAVPSSPCDVLAAWARQGVSVLAAPNARRRPRSVHWLSPGFLTQNFRICARFPWCAERERQCFCCGAADRTREERLAVPDEDRGPRRRDRHGPDLSPIGSTVSRSSIGCGVIACAPRRNARRNSRPLLAAAGTEED